VTHTDIKDNKFKYELLAGNKPERVLKESPFVIFNKDVVKFLSKLSKELLNNKQKIQAYTYFRGFGFWVRESNLINLRDSRTDINSRVGRGVTFHIAPSNIAANSLYSLAFGLLSGCPSIIRLSNKNISELKSIINLIQTIFNSNEFSKLSNKISFINYEHDETINSYFSSIVDSRIIWGGNETIQIFKSYKTASHCVDIVFPNKVSSSILSSQWLLSSDSNEIENKADLYARDIGLFSQMACSSPKSLLMIKDNKSCPKELLLDFFYKCDLSLSKKNWLSENQSLNNFKSSVDISIKFSNFKCIFKGTNLSVFLSDIDNLNEIYNYETKDSCIFISEVDSIDQAISLLPKNNQTIVCIGLKKQIKEKLAEKASLKGSNRFVSPGNALSMNLYWDGYDIISFLSRLISFN
tara:strand:- start:10441 stop:11670 length:1230 start_codon:yes stop_codon:yes gene_type:complete